MFKALLENPYWRFIIVLILGFASGLPLALTGATHGPVRTALFEKAAGLARDNSTGNSLCFGSSFHSEPFPKYAILSLLFLLPCFQPPRTLSRMHTEPTFWSNASGVWDLPFMFSVIEWLSFFLAEFPSSGLIPQKDTGSLGPMST
jgi:hypothetical protein